jgi:hypothetical protein
MNLNYISIFVLVKNQMKAVVYPSIIIFPLYPSTLQRKSLIFSSSTPSSLNQYTPNARSLHIMVNKVIQSLIPLLIDGVFSFFVKMYNNEMCHRKESLQKQILFYKMVRRKYISTIFSGEGERIEFGPTINEA